MRTLQIGIGLLTIVLAGCQTSVAIAPPPYPQRDLTVVWPDRVYWSPPDGTTRIARPPVARPPSERPPAPLPTPARTACARGAC
jgi:hypothetical protein